MSALPDNFLSNPAFADLNEESKNLLLKNLYIELESRVGEKLVELVSPEKFAEFEALADNASEDMIMDWLDKNCPGYEQTVQSILDELQNEAIANKEKFLDAT